MASSGTVTLNRPDKIRATRHGGFADVEMVFDGKTLTVLAKDANLYGQVDVPGTVDHLIDELRGKYHRPVPRTLPLSDPDLKIDFLLPKCEVIAFDAAHHTAAEILYIDHPRHQLVVDI